MEAIGAGAAVLPFVLLCLQSAKVAYETISSIKDAPKAVQDVQQNTLNLLSTLKRLEKCRALKEPGYWDDILVAKIKSCQSDIKAYNAKCHELAPLGSGHHRTKNTWRRLKTMLNEKDLDKMGKTMTSHAAILGLHLNAIQSDQVFKVKGNLDTIGRQVSAAQQTIVDNHTTVTQTIINQHEQTRTSIHTQVGDIRQTEHNVQAAIDINTSTMTDMRASITGEQTASKEAVLNALARQHGETRASIHAQLGMLSQIGDSMQAAVDSNTSIVTGMQASIIDQQKASEEAILRELVTNAAAVISAKDAAAEQSNTMMAMLSQMMEKMAQLSQLSQAQQTSPQVEEVEDELQEAAPVEDTPSNDILPYDVLEDNLKSILAALNNREGIFSLRDARDIAEPLTSLLQTMMSSAYLSQSQFYTSTYYEWCETIAKEDLLKFKDNLSSLLGMTLSAHKFAVNSSGPRSNARRMAPTTEETIVSHAQMQSFNTSSGSLSLITRERVYRRKRNCTCHEEQAHQSIDCSSYGGDADEVRHREIRLRYMPRYGEDSQFQRGFRAIMRQTATREEVITSIPRMFTYNIRPTTSRVFKVVECGNMAEFLEMLQSGEASLRDQDEHGASLLIYAAAQPQMCRYLIQHGADIDHVGGLPIHFRLKGTALFARSFDKYDVRDISRYRSTLECRKLLLDAGSDPTVSYILDDRGSIGLGLFHFMATGQPDEIRIFLDRANGFFTLESDISGDGTGFTPLLAVCWSTNVGVEMLSLLITRGADVHARTSLGGNCLHCIFSPSIGLYNKSCSGIASRVIAASLYLIGRGADPFAVDNEGKSVSQLAYAWDHMMSSISGDIWDLVMANIGVDVAENRRKYGFKRVAGYSEVYKRQDFEELWRGMEHLCPYYNHPEREWDDNTEWLSATKDEEGVTRDSGSSGESDPGDDSDNDGGVLL